MVTSEAPSNAVDVAVIGGGPAGSAVSTFLARSGRRIALIEKSRHPRFHVGESLLPRNLPILERLGVSDAVAAIGRYKPGAEFVSPHHEQRQVFPFADALDPSPDHAYNVTRAEFDEILLRHAAAAPGVDLWEGYSATDAERTADGWRVALAGESATAEIRAGFLIDASGRDGFLARSENLRQRSRRHNSAAIFAHFTNVSADAWSTDGSIAIYWFEHGWIWMIPLRDGLTSVGAVSMPDYLKTRNGPLDAFFFETLTLCPKAWAVLQDAERVSPVRGAGNYAYNAGKAFGDGYLLLGDSYAFVDPIFSSGIYFAMQSAERAAEAVNVALDRPDLASRHFRRYQRELDTAMARLTWFIYRFNSPILRDLFMRPRNFFGIRKAVVSILAGDVYRGGTLSLRLAVFKTVFHLSRLIHFRIDSDDRRRRADTTPLSLPDNEIAGRLQ